MENVEVEPAKEKRFREKGKKTREGNGVNAVSMSVSWWNYYLSNIC